MSTTPELDLDLQNLFQPAWAQGKPEINRFEQFTGEEGVRPERRGGDRPGRGPRREGGGGGGRGPGGGGGPRREGGFGGGGFGGGQRRSEGGRGPGGGRGDRRGGPGGGARRGERPEPERREAPTPLPEFNVAFSAEEKGVEQLARQVRMTGRAYPLFQIALLILEKAERYQVQLTARKKSGGTPKASNPAPSGEPAAQPTPAAEPPKLYICALDESPWLSADEVVAHVLKQHFATFYQAERTPTDPPKGVYTFVAQCGLSGVILGPPNYHDYQNQLRKLHAEKFSRMPFDMFKSRVRIVKDEAVVKKWIEEQSFKTVYHCLNVPEPLTLASLEEVEQHFRSTHKDAIIKVVETLTLAGPASRSLRCSGLQRLIRQEWEAQRRFPLPIATKLSQQFAHHGLQFFKVNKTVTHVSVARPTYLDTATVLVSDNIKRIVEFINATPKCTRKKLFEALAPTPKPTLISIPAPEATPAPAPVTTPTPEAAPVTGESPAPTAPTETTAVAAPAAPAPVEAAKPAAPQATPEQTMLASDLHWLIHQGHVIEFGDGRLETAKKPAPKPVKAPKVDSKPEAKTEAPAEAGSEGAVAAEAAVESTEPVHVSVAETPVAETAPSTEVAPVPAPAPVTEAVVETAPAAEGTTGTV